MKRFAARPISVPGLERGAQHLAGRDVGQPEARHDALGLGAFAGAGSAEQDDVELVSGHVPTSSGRDAGGSYLRKPS